MIAAKYPMKVVKSGLFIAEEMVNGASEAAFYATVEARFAPIVEAIVLKVL